MPTVPTAEPKATTYLLEKVDQLPKRRGGGRRSQQGRWVDALAPLLDDPGEWYKLASCPHAKRAYAIVANLGRGRVQLPAPHEQFEFRARQVDEAGTEYGVYGRYLGTEAAA